MTRFALTLFAAWLAAGCGSNCETDDPTDPVIYKGGALDSSGTVYESSGWSGPFLHFPPGRRYVIWHRLGRTPASYQTYLSFSERGLADGANNAAESAGNQAVVELVDPQVIQLRNDSCAELYLRVVATAAPTDAGAPPDASAGD